MIPVYEEERYPVYTFKENSRNYIEADINATQDLVDRANRVDAEWRAIQEEIKQLVEDTWKL